MPVRSATLDLVALTLFCAGLVYSAGQATSEIAAQNTLRDERRALARHVAALEGERERMQAKVVGLNGPMIDGELLDESVRRALGLGRPDEVLLLAPE